MKDDGQPVLLFEQVSKWYGPVIGLNQVTLELRRGITGLVGANGSGKSTLLRLATGQLKPTLGRVTVRGVDAWEWRAKALVGYCPDNDAFYEDMPGREFVAAMARLCGFEKAEALRRTEAVLERVGMADRADRKIGGYSKGMRQRIKLAQALLNDPQMLVLDEPLSGIDPIGRQEMLELFRGLAAEGKCLLVSSHELEELEKLTDHVAILTRGRIAAVGTVTQIRDMLDDQPLSVRIDVHDPRRLATLLVNRLEVVGVELEPKVLANGTHESLIVRARNPRRFFEDFGKLVVSEELDVARLEPLDDTAHAVLGYLLGGSGKT
ncbi:MAG: ABC transporter ATP-binding protein [Gemmataceae bacterium]|nr:ABC transporter ATP-binding protein [Gemmataceae bacterium]